MLEKAKKLKASQAKKSEYGESSKYVNFLSSNEDGKAIDKKIIVEINKKI